MHLPARLSWLRQISWQRPKWIVPLVLLVLLLMYGASRLSGWMFALLATIIVLIVLGEQLGSASLYVDQRLLNMFPGARRWPVHTKYFPLYKFVDLYRAAEALATQHAGSITLRSEQIASLSALLARRTGSADQRRFCVPTLVAQHVSADHEVFVPVDGFWLLRPGPHAALQPCIIRVHVRQSTGLIHLEIAAAYGDTEPSTGVQLAFYGAPSVTDDNIVLNPETRRVLEHTIIDFHQRRAVLMQLGVPGRRGVLFNGPPGTGKTFTCKYLARRLQPVTTIVATGHTLLHMKSVCTIARLLQLALVLLEDAAMLQAGMDVRAWVVQGLQQLFAHSE